MLYPVPNVFEFVVLIVARETLGEMAVRDFVFVALRPVVAIRLVERVVAARDEFVVAVRDVVVRAGDFIWVVGRVFTDWAVVREITLFCFAERPTVATWVFVVREIVDASRTAAQETPMPKKHAKTAGNTFLILSIE